MWITGRNATYGTNARLDRLRGRRAGRTFFVHMWWMAFALLRTTDNA